MMAVPATTAFEFGLGREAREWTGKERNDDWEFDDDGDPTPVENDHGGVQGGISSGEPIYGEVTLHAPTSIPKSQQTADWETGELKEEQVIGRHDPVLPPRGVPVVEAMLALTLVDFMLLSGRINPTASTISLASTIPTTIRATRATSNASRPVPGGDRSSRSPLDISLSG